MAAKPKKKCKNCIVAKCHGDLPDIFGSNGIGSSATVLSDGHIKKSGPTGWVVRRRSFPKNTKFSLLQIPESPTYIGRGEFWKAEPSAQDAQLRTATSRRSFETNAVWIAVMDTQSAARSIGRTRPSNSSLTTGNGSKSSGTIGVATKSRYS